MGANIDIVCIGHSHVNALALASRVAKLPIDVIAFWGEPEALSRKSGGLAFRPDLIDRLAIGVPIISCIGGSAHSVLGLVEHARPFDFVLPTAPELPLAADREVIPAEGVWAALTALDSSYAEILALLVRSAGGPVSHLEPPPPVADPERIRPHVPWGLFPGQPRKIAPQWLRYKLWRMHSELIAQCCATLGVAYVRTPIEALDGNGFLREGLDDDGIHAGATYGRMVLQGLGVAA